MPTINFKGKNAVWNHHLSLPYQILEKDKKLSIKGKNENENLIIEADNLIALKSLLPKYQGKIKCIYIDPPYNTENETWIYNDKVNSPLIKEWLGKIVDADNLTRHDMWLCMMTPRLKLLHELLNDYGVLFISIDDNEVHNLKALLYEIFGEKNFIAELVVIRAEGGGLAHQYIKGHDYVLVCAKNKDLFSPLRREKEIRGKIIEKEGKKYWLEEDWLRKEFGKYGTLLYEEIEKIKGKDKKNEIDIGIRNGNYQLVEKKKGQHVVARLRLLEKDGSKFYSILKHLNANGKDDLSALGLGDFFDFPKPVSLIKELILGSTFFKTNEDNIVLDSFAGSGTTAQAVMELNKEKGGNRRFILVQLPEKIKEEHPAYKAGFRYIHEITRERVKRVIERDKLEVGFSYMRLGPKIDADSILNGDLPSYNEFAKYVYYLATGKTLDNEELINEKDYFVGKINSKTIYLIYEKDMDKLKKMAITLNWAEEVNKKDNGKKIVYAPACFLDEEYLERFNINFVSIPYNLFEKK